MRNVIRRFNRDRSGATAVEYSLVVAIVAVSAIAGMDAFGASLIDMLDHIAQTINSVINERIAQG